MQVDQLSIYFSPLLAWG